MREFETCESGCDERRVELVAAGDLEELGRAVEVTRGRIAVAATVLQDLLRRAPTPDGLRAAHPSLARAARRALHDVDRSPWLSPPQPAVEPMRVELWRCVRCGGVDAPQECIGVCIWRRFEWVPADVFDRRRRRLTRLEELERSSFALLGRIAYATPREDAWEQNWRVIHREATRLLAQSRLGAR